MFSAFQWSTVGALAFLVIVTALGGVRDEHAWRVTVLLALGAMVGLYARQVMIHISLTSDAKRLTDEQFDEIIRQAKEDDSSSDS